MISELAGDLDLKIRAAQRDWEKAEKHLDECLAVYQQERDGMGKLSAAMALAAAYEEERLMHGIYEQLVNEAWHGESTR